MKMMPVNVYLKGDIIKLECVKLVGNMMGKEYTNYTLLFFNHLFKLHKNYPVAPILWLNSFQTQFAHGNVGHGCKI